MSAKLSATSTQFEDPDRDVILRSSDHVDFHVHRLILSKGSPVFNNLFHHPTTMKEENRVQTVLMEESACVISSLLQLCYPVEDPVIHRVDQLRPVIAALVKYQMDGIRRGWIKKMLSSAAESEPWGVYVTALTLGSISYHYQMVDEMRLAARMSLRLSVGGPLANELALITGVEYHRVMQYRNDCGTWLTSSSTFDRIFQSAGFDWVWFKRCSRDCVQIDRRRFDSEPDDTPTPLVSKWWKTYRNRVKVAIEKQPCGHVVEDEKLWHDLIRRLIDTCPRCAKITVSEMPRYAEEISKAVEAELSEVSDSSVSKLG
jgi:hypothetical protein